MSRSLSLGLGVTVRREGLMESPETINHQMNIAASVEVVIQMQPAHILVLESMAIRNSNSSTKFEHGLIKTHSPAGTLTSVDSTEAHMLIEYRGILARFPIPTQR